MHGGFASTFWTPAGHEDSLRIPIHADGGRQRVMVIDGAKGVEPQTRKLFKVCAMRHIPIFTFINKMDREAKDPFDLLDELERELGIETYAMNWPIGSGREFQGVYDREKSRILFFSGEGHGKKAAATEVDLDDAAVGALIGPNRWQKLQEEVELLGAGREFDMAAVQSGTLSPVFFGSALTNFGVEPFLEEFLRLTPAPLSRVADCGEIDVFSPDFSAFVFKIQANMNKAHRDRLASWRIAPQFQRTASISTCSGQKNCAQSKPPAE